LLKAGSGIVPIIGFLTIWYTVIIALVPANELPLDTLYGVIIPTYLGILAIVIAFTVLVVGSNGIKIKRVEEMRVAFKRLAGMYVVFTIISLSAMLLGTDLDANFVFTQVNINECSLSDDSISCLLDVCRVLAAELVVLIFPVGLGYLRAVINDFMDYKQEEK
jgi:hypothetical protein